MISELKTSAEIILGQTGRPTDSTVSKPTTSVGPVPKPVAAPPLPKPPSGNQLGTLDGSPSAPPVRPALTQIVRRFKPQLSLTANLTSLKAAAEKIAIEQKIQDEHAPNLVEARSRELSEVYAKAPTKENADNLRHSRTLLHSDHSLAQEHSRLRVRAVMKDVSAECQKVVALVGELLAEAAEGLWLQDSAIYGGWELSPVQSGLVAGLRAEARDHVNLGKTTVGYDRFPEIVEELLKQS